MRACKLALLLLALPFERTAKRPQLARLEGVKGRRSAARGKGRRSVGIERTMVARACVCECVCVCVCVCTEYERAVMQRRLGVASGDKACIHASPQRLA